jgi:hypothetical protein
MNVQVVCTLDGELVWISDPIEGVRHDVFCLDESGALHTLDRKHSAPLIVAGRDYGRVGHRVIGWRAI